MLSASGTSATGAPHALVSKKVINTRKVPLGTFEQNKNARVCSGIHELFASNFNPTHVLSSVRVSHPVLGWCACAFISGLESMSDFL